MRSQSYFFYNSFASDNRVYQFPILKDNYLYLITNANKQGVIVDPGASEQLLDFLNKHQITPVCIFITHNHHDHIGGLNVIKNNYPDIQVINYENQFDVKHLNERYGFSFQTWNSPGHVPEHIVFYSQQDGWLFSGDVLFRYGCGRIFDGTYDELYSSLKRISQLPNETWVFCTHEYTLKNLEFCISQNLIEKRFWCELQELSEHIPTVPFQLKDDLQYNPFLKASSSQEFQQLRELRNKF